jgi:Protein of unknown function (DUF1116)
MPIRAVIDFGKPFSGARWTDVLPRSAACPELPVTVLLHAGPPFSSALPAPVVNSAIQAILFEGLAEDAAQARDLLARGRVELRPAQDHGIATPLAQVVSASMPLIAVEQQNRVCYAPVVEGPAPALRFGSAAPECLRRLRDAAARIEAGVAPVVRREPVPLDTLIRTAVAAGDECHARTAVANESLASSLIGLDADNAAWLRANPAFVLAVLMAGAAAVLKGNGGAIDALGGNGIDFGIRRAASATWRQLPAQAPCGTRLPGRAETAPLAAIGDSALIDFCGLGGQALSAAPALLSEWGDALPADALSRRARLIDPVSGIADPERIVHAAAAPLINLAILDHDGAVGLIGRGVYVPPVELFRADS